MIRICNNCGRVMPDGVKFCPNCGQPTPFAPIDAEKEQPASPPPVPPTPPIGPEPPTMPYAQSTQVPQCCKPQGTPPSKQPRKHFGWAVAAAGAAMAIILLIFIVMYLKEHTQVTIKRTVSTQSIPINATGQADVDSIFKVMMQQSDQQLAIMDSLERAFMGDINIDAQSQTSPKQQSRQQTGTIAMSGLIGQQECLLHLNVADPQNVKGSARFVMKGKPGIPMKLIGLATGNGTLTVSIYKGEELAGTLVGQCDGQTYEGNFTTSTGNKEIPFSFKATR